MKGVGVEEFEAYVAARASALLRTAYLLTGDRQLAEDLVQDTLARVAQRWPSIVRHGNPDPYVHKVLYHRAVDAWRWRSRRPETIGTDRLPDATARSHDDAVDDTVVLREALARLTARQRAVLVLRFYEDRTEAESALLLGCSVNTVKSQARYALARLRVLAPDLAEAFGRETTESP